MPPLVSSRLSPGRETNIGYFYAHPITMGLHSQELDPATLHSPYAVAPERGNRPPRADCPASSYPPPLCHADLDLRVQSTAHEQSANNSSAPTNFSARAWSLCPRAQCLQMPGPTSPLCSRSISPGPWISTNSCGGAARGARIQTGAARTNTACGYDRHGRTTSRAGGATEYCTATDRVSSGKVSTYRSVQEEKGEEFIIHFINPLLGA